MGQHSFLLDLEERPVLASHFDGVAKLANHSPCYRRDYPRLFGELANVPRKPLLRTWKDEHLQHETI